MNGFAAITHTNPKASQLQHWFHHMALDFFVGSESKINWAQMPPLRHFPELFHSNTDLCTVAAFNSNESFGLCQYGGTFHLTMGQLALYVVDKGMDDQNLGCWAWTQLKGHQGPPTQIVLVYVPCWSTGEETVYRQQAQHLQ